MDIANRVKGYFQTPEDDDDDDDDDEEKKNKSPPKYESEMDPAITRSLNDKLYDKRKLGALELEKTIRECLAANDHPKIRAIIDQLCHEFAYAVHQTHARNGGLIGLAAASIALGPDVARYLEDIVPPVLACFEDQDARVRYYACESMYNIAKVAKGEILLFFNEVFDSLCKLTADTELSVKNGAELLDRLIKDIVAESAASYVSVLQGDHQSKKDSASDDFPDSTSFDLPTAFSLSRFIPLLTERIHVINRFTRQFLVSWIVLLDGIPDLELVTQLPAFLAGLFNFLSDESQDVHAATETCLENFLQEIKRIARIKRGISESRRSRADRRPRSRTLSESNSAVASDDEDKAPSYLGDNSHESTIAGFESFETDGSWVPGQDVQVDHTRILEILMPFLDSPQEDLQHTGFRWIDQFFEICPDDLLQFVPRLLTQVLPAISHENMTVRDSAHRVNESLLNLIMSLPSDPEPTPEMLAPNLIRTQGQFGSGQFGSDRRDSSSGRGLTPQPPKDEKDATGDPDLSQANSTPELDYSATVNALTLQFLNENEETRIVALDWLIMLHKKAHKKILAINDGTFPALLKTLSDPSEAVITKDLQLLSQISQNSDDDYFTSFMKNLLTLFSTDRRLLESRGNLIIRQLCVSLNPERIYRTLAEILEKDEDVEFASTMVQILNNNLITAPELADLRRRLRSLDSKDGQTFFVALFKSWCHNSVATFSLCLLAQAYEQASNLLQIFADLEITVNLLIQVDKLVQLLESPVFTYLRLQLLEPEKYPFLYKCLYGLLMLLPQSSAFAALKNRLNSVSAIGYLHIAPRSQPSGVSTAYEPRNRLKTRTESEIKWVELLDKFKFVQEKDRKHQQQYSTQSSSGSMIDQAGVTSAMAQAILTPSLTTTAAQGNLSMQHQQQGVPLAKRGGLGIGRFGNAATRRIRK